MDETQFLADAATITGPIGTLVISGYLLLRGQISEIRARFDALEDRTNQLEARTSGK